MCPVQFGVPVNVNVPIRVPFRVPITVPGPSLSKTVKLLCFYRDTRCDRNQLVFAIGGLQLSYLCDKLAARCCWSKFGVWVAETLGLGPDLISNKPAGPQSNLPLVHGGHLSSSAMLEWIIGTGAPGKLCSEGRNKS